jgi:predicted acylesterase/phospholipase RssA
MSEASAEARNILRGKSAAPRELLQLAMKLRGEKKFGLARMILERASEEARDDKTVLSKINQQRALCTYKDSDLPVDARLEWALAILKELGEDLARTTDQETLGLAGAIYKRRWEVDSQKANLERALHYYLRGYAQGAASDFGYTGINAAFLLDLLANQEAIEAERAGALSDSSKPRRELAKKIREDVLATLYAHSQQSPELERNWWFLLTAAEAAFGLGRYEEAAQKLEQARALADVPEWEFESSARQLALLSRIQHDSSAEQARQVIERFLGRNAAAVQSTLDGKVGLALSGGGFRASLFHIGVLARLAELDVLRKVEVLSCVSGGSIIGAHYYLEVRKLLHEKRDDEITREDYFDIVRRIERDFLAGVQRNIRTRAATEFLTNLKLVFWPNYSRTERVGELYEEEIFSRVDDGGAGKERWLNELHITPKGEKDFSPRSDNWKRNAKVPILVLNATTLNTGHNWQFTAGWMGEPPSAINSEIDGNDRLRRVPYDEAPEAHRRIRLGHAVAASSCVPGLFEPLVLDGLYPGRIVRLVDGGVHDNQGIASLLEQDCTVLLVSDASGQMESQKNPSAGILGVPLRSNSILMARVREAEYQELVARRRAQTTRALMFLHLKKDLDVDPVDWIGCEDAYSAPRGSRAAGKRGAMTSYGVLKRVQERLSAIRTDLDSFCDAEAYALMLAGYRMATHQYASAVSRDAAPKSDWRFLEIAPAMDCEKASEREHKSLMRLLKVANRRAFKIWRLSRPLQALALILAVTLLALAIWFARAQWDGQFVGTYGEVALTIMIFIALIAALTVIVRLIRFRKTLTQMATGLAMLTGSIFGKLHLWLFDRWYLRIGASAAKASALRREISHKSTHLPV